jgi:hypothetical protein
MAAHDGISGEESAELMMSRHPAHDSVRRYLYLLVALVAVVQSVHAADGGEMQFKRIPTQFIAALGDPAATSGGGAQAWGLWPVDPGPRGVRLNRYWLEENGLIMEQPEFPLAPGQYLVTGDREVTTVLTIHAAGENGDSRWALADGATLYDVTHLGCRSARYTPATGDGSCAPVNAPRDAFRVAPGAAMPPVEGCKKQDYAVLIVIAVGVED